MTSTASGKVGGGVAHVGRGTMPASTRHLSSAWRGRMTLRASYLLSEHYDQISPTSTRINNNINNERGSKNWVDFVSCRKNKKCSVAYVVLHFPDKYDADCVTLTSLISPTIKQTLK